MFQWYIRTLQYRNKNKFQHQIKSPFLNVKNEVEITFVIVIICVITPI
jgi:hypothetical protein